ncbi:MAG: histidine kinase dimerization/phosphoacceptor domain-containing protein, partial [Verrucomicrobiota bacterium]
MNPISIFLLLCGLNCVALAQTPPPLHTVDEVRALTLEEAGRGLPVRLRGVITYCNQRESRAFIQDESGGVFFRPPPLVEGEARLVAGDFVEINGITWRGRFSPSVAGDPAVADGEVRPVRLVRLGSALLPSPQPATVDRIRIGEFHNQFIKVRATIQRVGEQKLVGWSGLRIELSSRSGVLVALVRRDSPNEPVPTWEGVDAEIDAVVAGSGDHHGQFSDPWLAVDALSRVVPDFEGTERAFQQPVRGFHELFRYTPPSRAPVNERVHVTGTVTMVRPGMGYFLGNQEGGIWVEATHFPYVREGDVVDVIAFPVRLGRHDFLQDEVSRVRRHDAPLEPRPVTPEAASKGECLATLISVEGEVLDQLAKPGYSVLFLAGAGQRFTARFEGQPGTGENIPSPPVGSWVRIVGICETAPETPAASNSNGTFSVLVRSGADVMVLREARWLTTERLLWMLAAVAGGLLLCGAWVALLRRQVALQTRMIAHEVGQRTLIEERQRIARELHDTLQQQLAGVHLHLDAASDWAAG